MNSKRFLNAYASIESYLRNHVGGLKHSSFYELVDAAYKINSVVRRFSISLKEFGDLRNAIVHERQGGYVIAEPNSRAVNEIEHIAQLLFKPPTLIPMFQKQVITLSVSDPIAEAVKMIIEHSISQIPITADGRFTNLLTTNTIARWLGAMASDDIFSLNDTKISQVLKYTEDRTCHAFLSKSKSIFDALELFQDYEMRGKRLEALLITEKGRPSEKIIGIMTVTDLPKGFSAIGK